jgi:hypothetical protein
MLLIVYDWGKGGHMMTEYRQALCVELYDAGVMVRRHDGGGFCTADFPGFLLNGAMVERFLQHLGIVSRPAVTWRKGKQEESDLRDAEFKIRREAEWYGDGSGFDLTAIAARVVGPHLLELRLTARSANGETWNSEHTYCGAFAIEWCDAEAGE